MSKEHRGSRPKGYMRSWVPRDKHAEIIRQVKTVIAESTYEISVRFIFYRLVGRFGYPKTERDYKNLAELLVKARRAQLIPFSAITDSDPHLAGFSWGWSSRGEYLRAKKSCGGYALDAQEGQPFHIELWSEDAGSVPMLAGITSNYPISIYSTGGFSSVTVTHGIAERVLSRDKPTIFLHVGDFDPSGESIFQSMSQDVGAFVTDEYGGTWDPNTGETLLHPDNDGIDFRPVRVALTREQTIEWDLETAPPKATDSRSANWEGETVQVQAMTEDQMRDVVTGTLDNYYDWDVHHDLVERAQEQREEMEPLLATAIDGVIEKLGD